MSNRILQTSTGLRNHRRPKRWEWIPCWRCSWLNRSVNIHSRILNAQKIRTTTVPRQSRRGLAVPCCSVICVRLIRGDHGCRNGCDALPRFQDGARGYLRHAGKEGHQNSSRKDHFQSRFRILEKTTKGRTLHRKSPKILFFIGAQPQPSLDRRICSQATPHLLMRTKTFFKEPINGSTTHVVIRLLLCLLLHHVPLVVAVRHVDLSLQAPILHEENSQSEKRLNKRPNTIFTDTMVSEGVNVAEFRERSALIIDNLCLISIAK